MPEILKAAERYYLRVCPELSDKHCPGVVPVLERLTRRGVLLGLVTGNLTRIGWRKLERAGLHGYFRFGAFGEMAKNRAGLAKLAIREARGARLDRTRRGGVADRRCAAGYTGGARQPDSRDFGEDGDYARRGVGNIAAGPALARLAGVAAAYGGIRDQCGLIGYLVFCCSVVASGRSSM